MEKYLTYEEFGAVGDGVTDDIVAIAKCHEEANLRSLPVKARDGAKYYVSGKKCPATIKTDTDFGTAEFIIDDRAVESQWHFIFYVVSDNSDFDFEIKDISTISSHLENPYGKELFVNVFDDDKKVYIRSGGNCNNGDPQSDCFILSAEGEVRSPLNWEYKKITRAVAKFIDDEPITLKGGIFRTIANQRESRSAYYRRGINVSRSNVTFAGITHLVEGECDHGMPYAGFFTIGSCVNVVMRDCVLTPHRTYNRIDEGPAHGVPMGTYDINIGHCINVSLYNVTQSIDIQDRDYWGTYTSTFCKNLLLEDCALSRFDSHQGVNGVTIRRCKIGYQSLSMVGFGDAVIEDSSVYGRSVVTLRNDYGSFWRGNVYIRNCTWIPEKTPFAWQPPRTEMCVFHMINNGDHDYGYTCYLPEHVVIDGLFVDDREFLGDEPVFVFDDYDKNFSKDKPYPYVTTKKLEVSGVTVKSGKEITLARSPELFPGIEVCGI